MLLKTETIVNQVKQCPSRALRFKMNAEDDATTEFMETKVEVLEKWSSFSLWNIECDT